VVYVRRESAIIRFCATVAKGGSINDIVESKEVCLRQDSHSSAEAVRQIG